MRDMTMLDAWSAVFGCRDGHRHDADGGHWPGEKAVVGNKASDAGVREGRFPLKEMITAGAPLFTPAPLMLVDA
jgi:hypothetical protein